MAILHELEPLTKTPIPAKRDAPRSVFLGARSRERSMSENEVLAALRRMGYSKEEMAGHGFTPTADSVSKRGDEVLPAIAVAVSTRRRAPGRRTTA